MLQAHDELGVHDGEHSLALHWRPGSAGHASETPGIEALQEPLHWMVPQPTPPQTFGYEGQACPIFGAHTWQGAGSGALHEPPEYEPLVVLQAFDLLQAQPSMVGFVAQV